MTTKTENGKADESIAGASKEELELALLVFQQANFEAWEMKLLAAGIQKRLDVTLKAMA